MDFLPTTPIRRLAVVAGVIGCGVVASASVVEMLQPVAVQAQNTPSLMEFRWESDKTIASCTTSKRAPVRASARNTS